MTVKFHVFNAIHKMDSGTEFTLTHLTEMVRTALPDVGKSSVSSYLSDAHRRGYVEHLDHGSDGACWRRTDKNLDLAEYEHLRTTSRTRRKPRIEPAPSLSEVNLMEDLDTLHWILHTYIPQLEDKVRQAEQHAQSLYRQLNTMTGIFRRARELQTRYVTEHDLDMETIPHVRGGNGAAQEALPTDIGLEQ